jgi:hypothetical protein
MASKVQLIKLVCQWLSEYAPEILPFIQRYAAKNEIYMLQINPEQMHEIMCSVIGSTAT